MPSTHNAFQNRLLAAFPPEDVQRFFSDLRPVSLPLRHVLYDVGAPLDHVYFIEQGLSSILTSMSNGSTIEVGMIGTEGMVGVQVLLGGLTSNRQFIAQAPINALRMNAARCKAAFDQSAAVRGVMLRFAEAVFDLASQTAACNRLHSIEQRCARWLLMSSDRVRSDTIPMTHEFLASMLGVRRAGITTTLGELDRSGLINNGRGHVTITDREGLEATACECYEIDHRRLQGLP
ncbi:MAG TPA: Crp/Fnr family transcriptional regulator [Stellaceae bacterium]|nr:Crp/Fnr family transcriptional regulator [Stellaceae bacterium]